LPTGTYQPLATVTLGSSASSVTFSSIPSTYKDLILTIVGTSSEITSIRIRPNGDTGANFSHVVMRGNGSATDSYSSSNSTAFLQAALTTVQANNIVQIMDYSATDKHKTALVRQNLSSLQVIAGAERWANTSAITSLVISTVSGTFSTACVFNLYGIVS